MNLSEFQYIRRSLKLQTKGGISGGEDGSRLIFKPVTLSDLPLINRLLQHGDSRTCDFTVGGIFMWIDYFKYEYCVVNGTLFIKGFCVDHSDLEAFSYPTGDMELKDAVELIREYCLSENLAMNFSAVPEDKVDALSEFAGGRVEHLDDWADYLYDIDGLATLSGKKYNKKRNHVNRFVADNPGWRLEPLNYKNLDETKDFFSSLRLADKLDIHTAIYEREECFKVLDNLGSYPFEGAVLRDGEGRIVAFSIGEAIRDTLYVHIEKTDHSVSGANEAINQLFAREMLARHPRLRFVNREEDMGDPGLRYAKSSYHPVNLLGKYNIMA